MGFKKQGIIQLQYYWFAFIKLTHTEVIKVIDRIISKSMTLATAYNKAYDDQPGENIRQLTPAVVLSKTHVITPVDQTYNKNSPVGRDISILIDGAVSETNAGVQTDETAAARSDALNDMNLNPMTPEIGRAHV